MPDPQRDRRVPHLARRVVEFGHGRGSVRTTNQKLWHLVTCRNGLMLYRLVGEICLGHSFFQAKLSWTMAAILESTSAELTKKGVLRH